MNTPYHLVLASNSPRRRELLSTLRLEFEVRPSDAEETVASYQSPAEFVTILAARKANDVLKQFGGHHIPVFVIGSDTVVVVDGDILGKPRDRAHACQTLSRLQGRTHAVYTGLCLCGTNGFERLGYTSTTVTMRSITQDQIERYMDTGEPMDKAGAYAIQGYGSTIVTSIDGDYFTVVGLPLFLLHDYMREAGLHLY